MSARSRHAAGLLAALCAALALGGCAVGVGSDPDAPVALTITQDFGAKEVLDVPGTKVSGSDNVMSVLRRSAKVTTGAGGDVQAINGLAAGQRDGRPVDWYAYVNGSLTTKAPAAVDVHGGDRVWWDQHDAGVATDVRAIVGSFPEPFVHGQDGKRLPVRVECTDASSSSCNVVANKLIALGVPIGRSDISASAADDSLRILVGPWKQLRGRDAESDAVDSGPRVSGVFARFDAASDALAVLDNRGHVVRTLGAGTGLIAATRSQDREPVWFVTGTDDAGVASAARALDEGVLSNRYALAISDDLPIAVPARGESGAG